jgi:serine/threonine-protein kinase
MESGAERSLSPSILDYDVFELADRVFDAYPEPEGLEDFGPYQIRGRIDKGGMGEVWRAFDYIACREVAIKIPRYLSDPALRRRFATEVTHQAKLEHPFIARLYDHGVCPDGTPYFAMEFVDGKPLDGYCRDQKLSLTERVRLLRAVCEAVQYAHGLLVVHRDLKPSNILVKEDGTPKLLDFGVAARLASAGEPARQTQTEVGFTRAFAAPEQFRREPVGVHTDVYALGVILYQLLSGRLPYDLDDCTPGQAELMVTGDREPDKPSEVARKAGDWKTRKADWNDLDVLCLTAMKKDARRRYSSCVELTQDIDRYLRGEPLKARPDAFGYRAGKFVRRNWKVLAACAAVLALVAGLISFYTIRLAKARDAALLQARRAQRTEQFMLGMFGATGDAAPADDLRVVTVLDRAVRDAQALKNEPEVQADLLQTVGGIYQSLEKDDRAEALIQAALDTRRATFGEQSAEAADSMVALSYVRIDQARFAEAERLAERAMAIDRRVLKPDSPDLARAMAALGSVHEHTGAYESGIKVLEEAVRIQSEHPDNPKDLSNGLVYLANCQTLMGHLAAANVLHRRALEIDRRLYGEQHPNVAEDLGNLGEIEEQRGLYAESERHYRQSLAIDRVWYATDNPEFALMEVGLAKALVQENKDAEAEALLKHAIPVEERFMGKMHPFVATGMSWMGTVALKQGRLAEAEADFGRMSEICKSVYGEKNAHFAAVEMRMGELAVAKKQFGEAERRFQQAVQVFTETLSGDSLKTAIARIELGDVLVKERRYAEAEPLLTAGYKVVLRDSSSASTAALEAQSDLGEVYSALNQPEKAARFRMGN